VQVASARPRNIGRAPDSIRPSFGEHTRSDATPKSDPRHRRWVGRQPPIAGINAQCLLKTRDGHRVVLVAGVPIAHYAVGDAMAEAYAMVHLVAQGWVDQNEVARAFDRSERSVRRYQRRFEGGGLAALGRRGGYPAGRPRVDPPARSARQPTARGGQEPAPDRDHEGRSRGGGRGVAAPPRRHRDACVRDLAAARPGRGDRATSTGRVDSPYILRPNSVL
jgi:hypothetical protein